MNRESHHDAPQEADFSGATMIDSSLEVRAERERLRQDAYERVQNLLQHRIDIYSTSAKPSSPRAAFQGVEGFKAPTPEMLKEYKVLADLKKGKSVDDDVRNVLVAEREKAKALIKSEEASMRKELDDRIHGRAPGISSSELQAAGTAWENSPAKLALTAEINQLNNLILSLEAVN